MGGPRGEARGWSYRLAECSVEDLVAGGDQGGHGHEWLDRCGGGVVGRGVEGCEEGTDPREAGQRFRGGLGVRGSWDVGADLGQEEEPKGRGQVDEVLLEVVASAGVVCWPLPVPGVGVEVLLRLQAESLELILGEIEVLDASGQVEGYVVQAGLGGPLSLEEVEAEVGEI